METGKRLDIRLESFLRRNLNGEDYGRLYSSEPCVVLSPEEKKVHRYAILGHDQLYTLEIPPKRLKTVLRLEDITSIQLRHDLPNFLSGEEQLNTVHIQVEYKKVVAIKGSNKSSSTGSVQQSSPSTKLPAAALPSGGISAIPTSPGSDTLRSKMVHAFDTGTDGLKGRSLSMKSPGRYGKKGPALIKKSTESSETVSLQETLSSSQVSSTSSSALVGLDKEDEEESPRFGQSMERQLLLGQDQGDGRHALLSLPDLSITPIASSNTHTSSSSSIDVASRSMEGSSSTELATSWVEAALDLYILKRRTDFYDQIMVAWNDTKIRLMLEQLTPLSPEKHQSYSAEYFYHKFSTLREELLGATDLDSCTLLCHELSSAAQKYFKVKMLFWEDTDLLRVVLQLLKDRLSQCNMEASDPEQQLEHSVVLMDLLYQVLRETHSLNPRRLIHLFQDSGLVTLSTVIMRHFPFLTGNLDHMLVAEIVEKSCGILYEVFQAVEQARWLQCAGKFRVSSAWLVDRMLQHGNNIEDFLDKLVSYESDVLAMNPKGPGAQEQVTLYHIGNVQLTILRNSQSLVAYFKDHFSEEFKYYIARRNTQARLPATSPLTKDTLDVLQACSDRVLS